MRRSLVAGNWKMNGSSKSIKDLLGSIVSSLKPKAEVLICPPTIYMQQVRDILYGTSIKWGLQNVSGKVSGAYTGEISSLMAKDFGCKYAIIGHSERRSIYGETDRDIAEKFSILVDHGVVPILCVGESFEERKAGDTLNVVSRQLDRVLENAGSGRLNDFIVAYEPLWAIGTGLTATPKQAQEVHETIRKILAGKNKDMAQNTRILYGGSVKASNAVELMKQDDVDGGLIGGASLVAEDFMAICHAAG
ncbi:MAG: triose-phosphate isomerase [Candidatus Endonucleobacter bathymodioli]|uniref:Triosephosphate isomerase n=1 Tax=Candidatus Endonucleibacter bathymodioli TaxID=539814 RepID=A0AA90NKB9_9GAMM|nr:triose-phosphate isomerase [Candidatus Endonucleobacter bathymodioli]